MEQAIKTLRDHNHIRPAEEPAPIIDEGAEVLFYSCANGDRVFVSWSGKGPARLVIFNYDTASGDGTIRAPSRDLRNIAELLNAAANGMDNQGGSEKSVWDHVVKPIV